LERKVLAPKHVVSTDYGESNIAASRIVLPIASLQTKGLIVGLEKQGPRKNIAPVVVNGLTKGTKVMKYWTEIYCLRSERSSF
jgi:hypothetical protein